MTPIQSTLRLIEDFDVNNDRFSKSIKIFRRSPYGYRILLEIMQGHYQLTEEKITIEYISKVAQHLASRITVNNFLKDMQKVTDGKTDKKLSKTLNTKEIFLGHHFDDLKESYFLRKLQSSNIFGLSNIFNDQIDGINIHRPLVYFTKDKIRSYAKKNELLWFDDRSNLELDYTRNKIRHYLDVNPLISKSIESEIVSLSDIDVIKNFYSNYFFKIKKQRFEIKIKEFMQLNTTLQIMSVQSLYYDSRIFLKKQPRFENILNFIKIISSIKSNLMTKRSVFGGKIASFEKKICLNLL